jgi:hypothetical protein
LHALAQREYDEGLRESVRDRYLDLMRQHGHLVPVNATSHCCFGGCDLCAACGKCRNAPLFGGCTCGSSGCRSSSFGLD